MTKRKEDSGALYEIRIQGQLDSKWADWFDGMVINIENGITRLTGKITDEAALHGILKKIRDLGLKLVSVKILDKE